MALIDKASLLMVPSVYEDGTLYNVLPSGNKAPDETGNHNGYDQTRADFSFSRGSNLAATRVNAAGLIEKGRENLLLQSNNFNTTWIKNSGGTFNSGQSGYDGTNDAWQFNVTTASNSGVWQNLSFAGVATFSAYFKKGTIDKIGFTNYAGSAYECWFDLTNGTIGQQTGDLIDAKIEAVGTDGWYRCSITDIASGTNYFQLKPSNAYSGTSTAGYIFIQDAQVEMGLVATDYIETTTTTAVGGVLENMPRIDYSSGSGALLLEPLRTNLVPESEWFGTYGSNANGTGSLPLIYTNDAISPDGYKNATKIFFDAGSGTTTGDESQISKNIGGLTIGADYTLSFYAKGENGGEEIVARAVSGGYTKFTLTTEWKRYELTQSAAASSYAIWFGIRQGLGGIGTINSSATIYLWGVQEEAASYPSSYIPTMGTAASRAADSCSVTGASDVIGQTEGTIYGQLGDKPAESVYVFEMGQGSSQYRFFVYTDASQKLKVLVVDNYAVQVSYTSSVNVESNAKIAVAYALNDYAIYLNGSQLSTDTSASVPPMNQLAIGSDRGAVTTLSVNLKQVALFNERLSNTELAALTA